jgi:hypothetical protein
VPWVASLGGPGFVSSGDCNVWTAAIPNYGESARFFEVMSTKAGLSTTIRVPVVKVGLATFERVFTDSHSGEPEIALTVTDEASWQTRDLSMSVRT